MIKKDKIIKDKTKYLNYVNDIESKVNNIWNIAKNTPLSDNLKGQIQTIYDRILSRTSLVELKVNEETGLIPNCEWIGWQKEIDDLFGELTVLSKQIESD